MYFLFYVIVLASVIVPFDPLGLLNLILYVMTLSFAGLYKSVDFSVTFVDDDCGLGTVPMASL